MKKGQSVLQAAQKLANRHIKNSIDKAVNPISEEIKQYIATLVEADMPDKAPEILMMDIQDIAAMVLDFVNVYQSNDGIGVEIDMEQLVSLIESITSMINHNPEFIEETLDYFNNLQIDPNVIRDIVINNINKVI